MTIGKAIIDVYAREMQANGGNAATTKVMQEIQQGIEKCLEWGSEREPETFAKYLLAIAADIKQKNAAYFLPETEAEQAEVNKILEGFDTGGLKISRDDEEK